MGCSTYDPMILPEKKTLSNPNIRRGDITNLERETIVQRFQKGIMLDVFGFVLPPPNPAPSAKDETNTSNDRGLAALPKF
mmetsp:Transcript_758/g.908  ORF Transcript_758/g.908 Transcript_758/m.908 type:complete len:80 (+) Transcript_758:107-346(+)